jgi:hypothetical protein
VADNRAAAIVARTLKPPPRQATHWTARAVAGAVGLAVPTVQAIWKSETGKRAFQWKARPSNGLSPHRWRSFKLSNDPAFAGKLHDIVGLYVDPPAHAVVLSVDESEPANAIDGVDGARFRPRDVPHWVLYEVTNDGSHP